MTILALNKNTIRQEASAQSFSRGESYYRQGAVIPLMQRGNVLQAEVEGSHYNPYRVRVTFDQGGITGVTCDCPYDWGEWCKHIVAALLAYLHQSETIEIRPSLEELVGSLERGQMKGLLLNLAAGDPNLIDAIESQLVLLRAKPSPRPRHSTVDPQPIRRQVSHILGSLDHMRASEAYWLVGDVVGQVRQILGQVDDFVRAGDGRSALIILEAITDEYVADWHYLDDSDGLAGEFFDELGAVWTEAALTADLTRAERREWVQKLERWQDAISDYGIGDSFQVAQIATEQGWDYPPLQRILQGKITQQGAWDGEAPWYADGLTVARLNVLEQQERYQEYLYLAEAEGQTKRYVIMLARMGRARQAVEEGLQSLSTPDETLALAKTLREQQELASALQVAEHGLTLIGSQRSLAPWLRDLAEGMGKPELALQAAIVAVQAAPDLAAYLKAQELAGERWAGLQKELLDHLRQSAFLLAGDRVDIFLHEGLVDDAIAAVRRSADYGLIERVMDAVVEQRPDWVIRTARRQADRIIDAGTAKYYHHAVNWLGRARAGYLAAGREGAWKTYLNKIRAKHGRKYKLMGMLQGFED